MPCSVWGRRPSGRGETECWGGPDVLDSWQLPVSRVAAGAVGPGATGGRFGNMNLAEVDPVQTALTGRLCPPRGRVVRAVQEGRICAEERCNTRLSRYNSSDRCYRHQSPRFPRVRGRPLLGEPRPAAAERARAVL